MKFAIRYRFILDIYSLFLVTRTKAEKFHENLKKSWVLLFWSGLKVQKNEVIFKQIAYQSALYENHIENKLTI